MTDDTPSIEAVPTIYRGTTFRSRLEADWAATLDANHISWEYEPETLTLPSGAVYIPDFWLPELGTWIEAKGPNIPRVEKAVELAQTRACHCTEGCTCRWPGGELVLLGRQQLPPDPTHPGRRPSCGYANWETPHGPSAYYAACPRCFRSQWITLRRPWRCRVCQHSLEKERAYRAVDRELRFVEGTGGFGSAFAMPDLGTPFTTDEWPLDEAEDVS
ncbi:hypothetical protein ACIQFU_22930 [Streptomyces sp. NPDC093065]|uniref:hypothetical protein n=1 Tax=Streptomyces sp. NPDC093065 TaxID=3366021 RepID=UPI00380BEFD5